MPSGQISLLNESIDTLLDKEDELPLVVSAHQDLSSRQELTDATIGNLLSIGVLLPVEIEHYREVLDNYDYNTLVSVYIYSDELKDSQY
jgi:hypothetical protein